MSYIHVIVINKETGQGVSGATVGLGSEKGFVRTNDNGKATLETELNKDTVFVNGKKVWGADFVSNCPNPITVKI